MTLNIEGAWAKLKAGNYEEALKVLFGELDIMGVQEFFDKILAFLRDAIGLDAE